MDTEFDLYTKDKTDAVKEFNIRLRNGGSDFKFPENHLSEWLPKIDNRKIYEEYFLAVENNSVVRGAYIMKHQEFSFYGNIISIGNFRLPLSEGTINRSYRLIGAQLATDALDKQPLLFGLGAGGRETRAAKMLSNMGWSLYDIPFYFKVIHPAKFLINITYLKTSKFKKIFLDLMIITGIGWIVIKLCQNILKNRKIQGKEISIEIVKEFYPWADKLWETCMVKYSMIAVRDSAVLNILYPSSNQRFIRLKIMQGNEIIGWAVILNTKMSNHKQFGNMRVGSIIDCLALPENAFRVINSAAKFLEQRGVDIIVSNQSHKSWCTALKWAGFIKGPSNYIFASSKKLNELLHPFDLNKFFIHLTRGDGDGPINL